MKMAKALFQSFCRHKSFRSGVSCAGREPEGALVCVER